MPRRWRKAVTKTWMVIGPNAYCWAGAVIGIVSMTAFDWVHREYPFWHHVPFFPYESASFGQMLSVGTPGTLLFLIGTILAFVTFLGMVVQGLGIALFLANLGHLYYQPWAAGLDIGFSLALLSTFVVLLGWGLRMHCSPTRTYFSRIAALSPRIGLFAR